MHIARRPTETDGPGLTRDALGVRGAMRPEPNQLAAISHASRVPLVACAAGCWLLNSTPEDSSVVRSSAA
eukprot:4180476-Alexandrium_andersonii.AAC.1